MAQLIRLDPEGDGVKEYQALLDQLDEEAEKLKKQDAASTKRQAEIKVQVGGILDNLGGENVRVVAQVKSGRAWDRRISIRGAGLDIAELERVLGTESYRKLCDRTVEYIFNPVKLEEARKRKANKVTDRQLNRAMLKGTPGPSYYRPKYSDIEDESGDE